MNTDHYTLVELCSNELAKIMQKQGYINVNFDVDFVEGVHPTTGDSFKWVCEHNGKRLIKSKTIKQL